MLAQARLTLNLAKCEFGKTSVTYLGKQVGHGQVRPVDAKITAVVKFPVYGNGVSYVDFWVVIID